MLRRTLLVSLLVSVMSAPALAEQKCDEKKSATADMSRFKDNGAVLVDKASGKIWARCPLGMEWSNGSCGGHAQTYTWSAAEREVRDLNKAKMGGHSNWRLPSKDELLTIVESRCFKPAIDLQVFPYTPESGFWTGTTDKGVNPRAWVVHFVHGQPYIGNQQQRWRVRPVAD